MSQYDTTYSMPFMYIDQPELQAVEVTMQSNYHTAVKDANQTQTTKEQSMIEEDQKFKDMAIQDKIAYLMYEPGEMPPLRCEVKTKEEAFQGVLIEENETEVTLRAFGKGYQIFNKEDIIDIFLIGF